MSNSKDLDDLRPGLIRTHKDLEKALEKHGFVLIRKKKHAVWRLGNRNITLPKTSSDWRYLANVVSAMRKIIIDVQNTKKEQNNKNIDFPEP